MVTDQGERKLVAILAADVAGYSRLMADDENATVICSPAIVMVVIPVPVGSVTYVISRSAAASPPPLVSS